MRDCSSNRTGEKQAKTGRRLRNRIVRRGLALSLIAGVTGLSAAPIQAMASSGPMMYVADFNANTVSVIDLSTKTVTRSISVGQYPDTVAVTPDGTRAYVTIGGSNIVQVIDTNALSSTYNQVIGTVTVGSQPRGIAMTSDGTRAYVCNTVTDSISVIDTNPADGTKYNTVVQTIHLDFVPWYITVAPDDTEAYIGNYTGGSIGVMDINPQHGSTTYNQIIKTITAGVRPIDMAFTPDGTRAYVANQGSGTVSVIDTNTGSIQATIPVGYEPWSIAMNPMGTRAYVANAYSDTVSIIDTTTNTVIKTVRIGATIQGQGQHISLAPDGNTGFVGQNDELVMIDTNPSDESNSNLVIGQISGLATPVGTGFVPSQVGGLVNSGVNATGWTESWNPVDGSTGYNVYLNGVLASQDVQGTSYSFQSKQPGTSYTVTVAALGGNVQGPLSSSDNVMTSLPSFKAQLSPSTPNGQNDWYISPVSVSMNTDTPSLDYEYNINGTGWQSYSEPFDVSADGDYNVMYGWTDSSLNGTVQNEQSIDFSIDHTPPTITGKATTDPNSNGWYNSPVTVHFTANDSLSGVATVTPDQTISTEGQNQSVSGTAIDKAGNSVTTTVYGINVDMTPPVTSATLDPTSPDGKNNWYRSNIKMTLNATDNLSGVASTEYRLNGGNWLPYSSPITFSTDGQYTVEYRSTDVVGNVEGAKTVSFNIDKTPPSISGAATTSPNANGWYNKPVTVHFTASDAMSGLASVTPDQLLSTDGANQSVTATAIDNAGNSNTTTVTGINIDQTPPTTTVTVDKPTLWPPNNKFVPITVTVHAQDSGSGVASVTLTSITCNEDANPADYVQGAQLGADCTKFSLLATRNGKGTGRVYTITYTVTDKAGNSTTASATVTVPHDQGK